MPRAKEAIDAAAEFIRLLPDLAAP